MENQEIKEANRKAMPMFTIAVFVPLILSPYYMKTKKMLLSWDGEDEEISDGIEKRLSVIIWVTSGGLIISYFLIGAVYLKGLEIFKSR